jgi:hypothetical protein
MSMVSPRVILCHLPVCRGMLLCCGPRRAAAFVSGIDNAMTMVIHAFSPPCFLFKNVGTSPFALSLVEPSISMPGNKAGSVDGDGMLLVDDTAASTLQMGAEDQAKDDDGKDSNVEGGGAQFTP